LERALDCGERAGEQASGRASEKETETKRGREIETGEDHLSGSGVCVC